MSRYVSIWPTGFLWFWKLHKAQISIPKEFFDSATFSPRNLASKFALQPRPIKLAVPFEDGLLVV